MTVRFDVRVNPTGAIRDLSRRLLEFLRLVDNQEDMFRALGDDLIATIRLNFNRGVDPYGVPWKPSYRAQCTTGGKTLIDTERLLNGFRAETSRNGMRLVNNTPYAATHQTGATIRARNKPYLVFRVCGRFVRKKEVKIPARPFMPDGRGIPTAWVRSIDGQIGRKVDTDMRAAFGG